MNKKLVGILMLGLIIIGIVVVLTARRSAAPAGPAPSPTLAAPGPTGIFPQPTNVTYSFAAPPSIPVSLPTYTFQTASLAVVEQQAAKAAAVLGLDPTPATLVRGDSYTKTWSHPNEAALTVTQTNGNISVTFRQAKTSQKPNATTPETAVRQFLAAIVPPAPQITIKAAGTAAGPFDGLLVLDTPAPASFTNYFYSYILDSTPLLTADLSVVPASAIADSGGIIRFASIVPPPSSFAAGPATPLLTGDQVLESLAAGRGTLLDTHNPQTPTQGEVPDFSRVVIDEATIVWAPQDNRLLPALYMKGTGTAANGSTQKITVFLWLETAAP